MTSSAVKGICKTEELWKIHKRCVVPPGQLVQALISVQALVYDLAQLTCQKRFGCRKAILRSSAILLGTSYSQIVVAVLL